MHRILTGTFGAAAVAMAVTFTGAGPATAQMMGPRIAAHANDVGARVIPVAGGAGGWHGRARWRGPGWRYGRRWGWRRGWGWGWWGPAFATGVIVGGALSAPPYYYRRRPGYVTDDAIAYCMQRFKSYDPYSMTYLGYDGHRHPCP